MSIHESGAGTDGGSVAAPQSPPVASSPAAPDWETIMRDVLCPLCGYNLRGLSNPRCPECGYQFEWPSVLDPDKDRHPYLFEHHPERNVRSFLQTLFRSPLSPSNFWHTLDPAQRVRLGRLVLYWLIYAMIALLPTLIAVGVIIWRDAQYPSAGGSLWSNLHHGAANVRWNGIVSAVILLPLFPWLNFLVLIVFQQSMRRSRVRAIHVLRSAIYCGDLVLWFSVATTAVLLLVYPDQLFARIGNPAMALFLRADPVLILLGFALLAMILLNCLRLWVAYRTYLRFPRALSLVVASQVVVLLALLAALVCTSEYLR
jgi:rubredoxin